jgi:hypothetical protein
MHLRVTRLRKSNSSSNCCMPFICLSFLSCADIDDNAGEGLGGSRKGIADPVMAGSVKKDNLGVGAVQQVLVLCLLIHSTMEF